MANIRVDLTEPLLNGMDIKFKAPCDCTAITGMVVYAPDNDGNVVSQTFTFKDAHGNVLTGLGNLFSKDALVKVMVDTDNSSAYIQNADTNKYLENKIANAGTKVTLSSSVTSTSTTTAANSYAVKQAYDKAVEASNTAGTTVNFTLAVSSLSASTFSLTSTSYPEQKCGYRKIGNTVIVSVFLRGAITGGTQLLTFTTTTKLPPFASIWNMRTVPVCVNLGSGDSHLGSCHVLTHDGGTEFKIQMSSNLSATSDVQIAVSFVYEATS